MKPKVSIIILNWNGVRNTLECLESVYNQDYPNYDVIVVDNGSTDKSIELIKQEYPNTAIIENATNLGYAEGNNIGLDYSSRGGADYLFILNNDTVLKIDCLSNLIRDIEQYPDVGAIAPISFFYHQPEKCHFAGGNISLNGSTQHIQKSIADINTLVNPYHTEWLTGCAVVVRNLMYLKVGSFDKRFFLLFEDVDWSLRVRRASFYLMMSPQAWIYHKISASFDKNWSPTYFYYYTRNNFLFLEKNFPFIERVKLSFHQFRRLRWTKMKLSEKKPSLANRYKKSFCLGIRDYIFRNFGENKKINDNLGQ